MKIRLGFVSNSSSSSFCIYGASFDKKKDEIDLYEYLEEKAEKSGLEVQCHSDADLYCVGRSFDSIGADETGNQFKQSIENKLKEIFEKDDNVSMSSFGRFEDSWYDG